MYGAKWMRKFGSNHGNTGCWFLSRYVVGVDSKLIGVVLAGTQQVEGILYHDDPLTPVWNFAWTFWESMSACAFVLYWCGKAFSAQTLVVGKLGGESQAPGEKKGN
jgi:hypothetical protein